MFYSVTVYREQDKMPSRTQTASADKEKDAVLTALECWRAQRLSTLLSHLPEGPQLEKTIEEELQEVVTELHEQVLDPLQRHAAAERLEGLQLLSKLQSAAFQQAKLALVRSQDVLRARNVEDDKQIQNLLETFHLQGLRSLLGHPPAEEAVGRAAELFRERLRHIASCVRKHLALAEGSLDSPDAFAEEFAKLVTAKEEVGDFLELHEDGPAT